jgi:hypothetical protein
MKKLERFLSNVVLVLTEARKAYVKRHSNHLLGS